MAVLVLVDHDGSAVTQPTRCAVAAAGQIDKDVHVLVLGAEGADAAAKLPGVSKVLKALIGEENPELVVMGKQAIDGDNAATGQMLAAILEWPQATFASAVEVAGGSAKVTREVDGGLQTIDVSLPAVVTADLRLNEPRYASLPNIMKARKKPIETVTPADLGVDPAPRLSTLKVEEPPKRQAGKKVGSVAELVEKLRNEAKVI